MSSRAQLDQYLQQARQRLRLILLSRGAALLVALLLLVTLGAALWLNRQAFSDIAVAIGRAALIAGALGVGVYGFLRWRALNRNEGGDALEQALPAQSGRIHTYLQERRKEGQAPFLLELLADDAARIADAEPLTQSIPSRQLLIPGAVAAAAFAGLIAIFFVGGSLGDGARHLWLGKLPAASRIAVAAGGIAVRPGDISVRRNQDLPISALVAGGGRDAQVHVRFGDGEWEVAPMSAEKDGGYSFTLFAVRDAAQYYVTAGNLRSKQHTIAVVDLPRIESLRLTYHYPGWTGLPQQVQEASGDIRAVAGTQVQLEIKTDKPLTGPLLVINGASSSLSQSDRVASGGVSVKQPGHYRIATRFGNEVVPLTQDYIIDVVADEKPTVQIMKPGRDYRATAIEEVPVGVKAQDDFRLEALELHYSVNAGEWRTEKLNAGAADVQAAALLRLEELQQKGPKGEAPLLVPGDLVSYYAVARDHSSSAQTDLFLIQVQPFDQRYTQSQANGGGGGGGGGGDQDDQQISQKQREVLLATFNLQRNKSQEPGRQAERDADNARMLSEVQSTLAEQAGTLVERAKARQLTGSDESVTQFVKSLEEATKAMRPAVDELDKQNLEAAVKHEQQALQHLLRAEATLREIQVSMQRGGGGGGGGRGQAARDVSEMTELEMDLAKNQYETQPEMSQQQRGEAESDALKRLRELAKRQEQLAREAARQQQPTEAQKWQQEQLRREAEQLRQQLEQLAQNQRGGSQQNGGQQNGQQSGGQGQSSAAQAAAEAARQVSEAMRQMQARNNSQGSSKEAADRATEQLNRATEQLERGRRQATGDKFNDLARSARDLGEKQRQSEEELRAALTPQAPASIAKPGAQQRSGLSYDQAEKLAQAKRDIQAGLEDLQRQMRAARQQSGESAPRASERVGKAAQELQESDTGSRLARSALEIERGRGVQAAAREGLISESLQQLQQGLEEAASLAGNEQGERRNGARKANPDDLLAELGDLRRALERAKAQGMAQNGQNGGDAGTRSPEARNGQAGQSGGQTGQQGEGAQSQSAQGQQGQGGAQAGNQAGNQGGPNGGRQNGGIGGPNNFGGGADWGGRGRLVGGNLNVGQLTPGEREALREQGQISSQRLQQLRDQLAGGPLAEADLTALRELSERLRRGGADPLSTEFPRMDALLNQLELAALKAQSSTAKNNPTRANGTVDDSRRYRDNVAEYYRKLGGTNDEK
ncbi:MAG TPA: hypothetical protein VN645_00905 [Steroidobacteraceae bacterium]|nr:hypothetical protein [Steroidobacteraceae bacterium]